MPAIAVEKSTFEFTLILERDMTEDEVDDLYGRLLEDDDHVDALSGAVAGVPRLMVERKGTSLREAVQTMRHYLDAYRIAVCKVELEPDALIE